ncbi:L,D-transpeptidase family protein [Dinoroseobacter sp. S124A]|uniref:L,D-transpeptidase family protein n=1 Tax=Dinoroseobacter sp. S124A TaxID=3415128 RepID=UPI003C7E3116
MTPTDLVLTPLGLRFGGRVLPCTIGRGGLSAAKAEGDGATPLGVHRLIGMLYRPDRMAPPANWALPIRPRDGWSDDVADPDYNLIIRRPHPFGHERLWRADPLYDLVVLTDWNWPQARKGAGSAIFIHQWRGAGRPTEGCIGLARDDLRWLAPRITLQSRLIVG